MASRGPRSPGRCTTRATPRHSRTATCRSPGHRAEETVRHQLAGIERSLTAVDARLRALRARHSTRQAFLADHEADATRLALVRRAETARELKVRAEAAVRVGCPEIFRSAGERHLARHSAERALLQADRQGRSLDDSVLDQPDAIYEEVARRRPARPVADIVGPEEPSLF